MILTFNDFVHKHKLKNKATSNVKIYEVLKKIGLDSKVRIYLRDGDFFCASHCLYLLYLTKVIGIVFTSAVLNLYYQRRS